MGTTMVEAPGAIGDDAEVAEAQREAGPDLGGVLGAVAALMGLLTGIARVHDNSFLTHLATGRLILDGGGIPRVDPYSFTAHGDPWVVQSWLASVIYAAVDDVAGFGGIRLLNGLLCAGIAVCVWLLTARSPSAAVRFGVTAVAMLVASELLAGRPLLFGMLGFLLVFLAAEGRVDPRWLVPVGWIWVNTHGSFPFALVLVGLLGLGHRLDEGAWGREVKVGLWAAAGIALGVVNPLGVKILLFPATLLRRTEAFSAVVEWQAPDYTRWSQWVVAGLLLAAVVLLVPRFSWRLALPMAVFGVLGLTSQRNQLVLVLVLAPTLVSLLPAVGPAVASVRRPILRPARTVVIALTVLFALVGLQGPHLSLDAYPEEASVWMEDEGLWGPDSRVVAPDFVGNLREAQAGRQARVFFDDRVDMYPVALIEDYLTLHDAETGWDQVLARRGATAVLWEADTPLGRALLDDPGWQVVHRDAPWVVFVPAPSR
ncbi:MAG TPA: hypothetical protein VGO60_06700 [Iamia sp.]|nr:hypothetical protein [Iamia sp.]